MPLVYIIDINIKYTDVDYIFIALQCFWCSLTSSGFNLEFLLYEVYSSYHVTWQVRLSISFIKFGCEEHLCFPWYFCYSYMYYPYYMYFRHGSTFSKWNKRSIPKKKSIGVILNSLMIKMLWNTLKRFVLCNFSYG